MTKAMWGRKALSQCTTLRSQPIREGGQSRNSRQEQKGRPQRRAAYWPVAYGLLSLLP